MAFINWFIPPFPQASPKLNWGNGTPFPHSPTPYRGGGWGNARGKDFGQLLADMKKHKTPREPRISVRIPGGPIDWPAWVAEASQPRGNKGRKYGPEICAKFSAGQRKRFAAQRAKLAAALAAEKKPQPPYDPWAFVTVTDRLLGSMQPGSWYAVPDMANVAPAVKYNACKAFAVTWWRAGIFKRRQNPDWKPPARVGAPQEPKWLYSLSPEGERRHRLVAALL